MTSGRLWVFWLICLGQCAPLCLATGKVDDRTRLQANDIFVLQLAMDPHISPDGKEIVYVRRYADIQTDERYSNLWIVGADGSGHRPLTSGRRHDSSPRWSPDGTRLAFLAEEDGHSQVVVRWMKSGESAQITHSDEPPLTFAWSPDGTQIAYAARVPAPQPRIVDIPPPPAGAKWAPGPQVIDRLVYRFDKLGYINPGYTQIFVIAATGGPPRQLSEGGFDNGGTPLVPAHLVWTPDGQDLITSINREVDVDLEPFNTDVYDFSLSGGSPRVLTHFRGPKTEAVVSPDGKLIAYVGFVDQRQGYQVTKLRVMARNGDSDHIVAGIPDRDISSPTWASDGRGIYFRYQDAGATKIGFISNAGEFSNVAGNLAVGMTAYDNVSSFSISNTNVITYTSGTAATPGDVAVVRGQEAASITSINKEYLTQKAVGDVEELWWQSSKDKRSIQGWIVKPPDFDPSKKYPLILEIHGGPYSNYGARFDLAKQVWAARGYVVLYANPRGSTSYGEEFGNLIHRKFPGDDFDDLNSGVSALLKRGYIDSRNLFVTGYSGGAILTAWMTENTNRFRAAAMLSPVVNWYSFALTTDIPFVMRYWFAGEPWHNTSDYMNHSLTNLVDQVKTPTLVVNGEEDYRTPISEAEQYYAALKLRHVETVFVRVPGEPHGLTRYPSHSALATQYILAWFEQHRVD